MAFLQSYLSAISSGVKEIIYWGDPIDNGNSMMMTYLNYHNRPTFECFFSISPAIGFWHPNSKYRREETMDDNRWHRV